MSDWKSRAISVNPDKNWKGRALPVDEPQQESGILPTIVDKLAQGGAMGFADELSGAGEALGQAAGVEGLGGKIKDIHLSDRGPTTDWDVIKHAYMHGRNKDREVLKKESEDHPIVSNVAELAGGVMSPLNKLIPAGASGFTSGAAIGGVYGAGNSNADNPVDLAIDTTIGGSLGASGGYLADKVINGVPKLFGKGIDAAKQKISDKLGLSSDYTQIPNKEAVESAAKNLGISDIPKAVLTDNPTYQKLESGLSQSGSFPAKPIRDQYNQFFKGVDEASNKISSLKTPDSEFSIGQNIQKGLADQVNSMRAPVTEMYKDLTPLMQKVPVDQQVVNTAFGSLKRNPLFQTADGKAMLEEYKSIAQSQPELNSLKEWRSTLGDSLNNMSSPLDEKRVSALLDTVTYIRDNSVNAMKKDLPQNMHGEVDNLINQISLADSAHASNINDVNSIKGLLGNKEFKSPINFLNKLGETKEADLAERAGNLDISSLRNMQSKFPSIFDKAKTSKINDMIQRSTSPISGFDEARFLKQYDGMDQELKDLVFAPEMQSHINSLKTIRQAIPPKLGPSGTPEGQMMMDMFNPKRNALDFGISKALQKSSSPVSGPMQKIPDKVLSPVIANPVLQMFPRRSYQPEAFPRAADKPDNSADNFHDSLNKEALLQKTQGSKYGQVLQNAAQKGEQSLNAAHFVLSQRDPEYRKIIGDGGDR